MVYREIPNTNFEAQNKFKYQNAKGKGAGQNPKWVEQRRDSCHDEGFVATGVATLRLNFELPSCSLIFEF